MVKLSLALTVVLLVCQNARSSSLVPSTLSSLLHTAHQHQSKRSVFNSNHNSLIVGAPASLSSSSSTSSSSSSLSPLLPQRQNLHHHHPHLIHQSTTWQGITGNSLTNLSSSIIHRQQSSIMLGNNIKQPISQLPPPPPQQQQPDWIGNGHLQFTFDLLGALFMNNLDLKTGNLESIAFSPFSIQSILMMLHLGAKGQTKSEIARVLHLESTENNVTFSKSHETFGQAVKSLLQDTNVNRLLHGANQIFLQDGFSVSNTYALALNRYHSSTVKYLNFAKESYQSMIKINDWIEKQTQHMISNFLVTPPSPSTLVMAINAVRFKGDWQYRFDSSDTEKNAWFRTMNGQTAKVDMMVGQLPVAFAHSTTLQASIIELPFKTQRLGFFLLLPDDTLGIYPLLNSLNATVFANLLYSMKKTTTAPTKSLSAHNNDKQSVKKPLPQKSSLQPLSTPKPLGVNIRIPKFLISSTPRISQVLRNQLGLTTLFSNENANLEAMFSHRPPGIGSISVGELLHKAVLKIDENGSIGAAVSSSSIERIGSFNGPYFEADHPFIYLLMDKQTGLSLFAGIYSGPNKNEINENGLFHHLHQQHHVLGLMKPEKFAKLNDDSKAKPDQSPPLPPLSSSSIAQPSSTIKPKSDNNKQSSNSKKQRRSKSSHNEYSIFF